MAEVASTSVRHGDEIVFIPTADVVLVFVEMQPEIVQASATVRPERLAEAAATLRGAADGLGIPTLASVVPMRSGPVELIDELQGVETHARTTIGIFDHWPLAERLRSFDRATVVIAGVSSEIAVVHSALGARREGLDVRIPLDCCGGLSDRTEASAFSIAAAAGCQLTNISTLLTGIVADMGSDEGRVVMSALGRYWGWA